MKRKDESYELEVWVFEDVLEYGYIVIQASFEEALKGAKKFCKDHEISMKVKGKVFTFEMYRNGKMIDEKHFSPDEVREELTRLKSLKKEWSKGMRLSRQDEERTSGV